MVISDHELFTKNAKDIESDLKAFIPEMNKELPGGISLDLKGTTQTSCDILPSEVQEHLQKEEIIVEHFNTLVKFAAENNFIHYEISNFGNASGKATFLF